MNTIPPTLPAPPSAVRTLARVLEELARIDVEIVEFTYDDTTAADVAQYQIARAHLATARDNLAKIAERMNEGTARERRERAREVVRKRREKEEANK